MGILIKCIFFPSRLRALTSLVSLFPFFFVRVFVLDISSLDLSFFSVLYHSRGRNIHLAYL